MVKAVPIVLMTVNTREDAKKEYLELGFSDCIAKPVEEYGSNIRITADTDDQGNALFSFGNDSAVIGYIEPDRGFFTIH